MEDERTSDGLLDEIKRVDGPDLRQCQIVGVIQQKPPPPIRGAETTTYVAVACRYQPTTGQVDDQHLTRCLTNLRHFAESHSFSTKGIVSQSAFHRARSRSKSGSRSRPFA